MGTNQRRSLPHSRLNYSLLPNLIPLFDLWSATIRISSKGGTSHAYKPPSFVEARQTTVLLSRIQWVSFFFFFFFFFFMCILVSFPQLDTCVRVEPPSTTRLSACSSLIPICLISPPFLLSRTTLNLAAFVSGREWPDDISLCLG
jgi:hypothetical protein